MVLFFCISLVSVVLFMSLIANVLQLGGVRDFYCRTVTIVGSIEFRLNLADLVQRVYFSGHIAKPMLKTKPSVASIHLTNIP
jgi:hypothetical protein